MFKLINGWTKATVMAKVKEMNNNTQCRNENGNCVYDDGKGNHCAIGCFIPLNHGAMQGEPSIQAIKLVTRYPDLALCMPFEVMYLNDFQIAHDNAKSCDLTVYEAVEKFLNERVTE